MRNLLLKARQCRPYQSQASGIPPSPCSRRRTASGWGLVLSAQPCGLSRIGYAKLGFSVRRAAAVGQLRASALPLEQLQTKIEIRRVEGALNTSLLQLGIRFVPDQIHDKLFLHRQGGVVVDI